MNISTRQEHIRGKYEPAPVAPGGNGNNEKDAEEGTGNNNDEEEEQGSSVNIYDQSEVEDIENLSPESGGKNHENSGLFFRLTPGANPSLIKQGLIMLLSAFVGATIMILILGGRKTYNITEVIPSPPTSTISAPNPSSSIPPNRAQVVTSTSLPFSISYAIKYNGSPYEENQLRDTCRKVLSATSGFLDEKIKLYFLTTFPQFQVVNTRLESSTYHNMKVTQQMLRSPTSGANQQLQINLKVDFVAGDDGPISYVIPETQLTDALIWSFYDYKGNGYPKRSDIPVIFISFMKAQIKDATSFDAVQDVFPSSLYYNP